MPTNGVQEITPDTSESQPSLPTAAADLEGHSAADAFMASQPYFMPGMMPIDSFFAANSSSTAAKPRHRKNRSTKTIVKAEDIPEYKGQMPVDDLVNFINSGKSKKVSVKKKLVKNNSRAELLQSDGKTNGDMCSLTEFDEMEEQSSVKVEAAKESISTEKSVSQHMEMETSASTMDSRTEGEVFPADSSYWKDFTPVRRRKKGKIQQQMEDDSKASNSATSLDHTEPRDNMNPIREVKPSLSAANKREMLPLNTIKTIKPNPEESHSSKASCNRLHFVIEPCTSDACTNHETLRKHEDCDVLKMNDVQGIIMKNDNQCSIINSMTSLIHRGNCPAAGITSQSEPVIFVDRKDKGYTKIDISFGFGIQDSDCGSNKPSDVDVMLPESCSCRIIQHSLPYTDSASVNDTDENNNHGKHNAHICCHTKQAKSTPPTASYGSETSHLNMPTKRISTPSPNESRVDSLICNVKCNVHSNCSGRPISVVAPNQPLNSNIHSSHIRLISTLNQGTVTGQKPLGTVKQPESVHSASPCACMGHNLSQTLSCSPATGSCGPAPVLKVAPMLMENFGTTSLATEEVVDGPVKEDISRKSSILNSSDDENGQKQITITSGEYQEDPRDDDNERTETVEIDKEMQSPSDQICSTVKDKNFHCCISPQDSLAFSKLQSHVLDQNDPQDNNDDQCVSNEDDSFSSDITAYHSADVDSEIGHHPTEDSFDLFIAQIFLYKSKQSFSASLINYHTIN